MAYTFTTALKSVAIKYVELLKVNVSKTSVQKAIIENPYFPSLLAMSDAFDRFHIPNKAFRIDRIDFEELVSETPFIAFVKLPKIGSDFVLVTEISDNTVRYFHQERNETIIAKEDFLQRYQGIVWKAEPNSESGERDFGKKIKEENKAKISKLLLSFSALIISSILVGINTSEHNILLFSSLVSIKILGFATTILLLVYEIDKNNAFVKNICSVNGKSNCDAVLSSSASKIGGISWGEIGFFYFASTTIGLLFPNIPFEVKTQWLAIANMFAAPYILFSLYYQWKIIKQWCPLCLVIQATLFSELLWSIVFVWPNDVYDLWQSQTLFSILFCVLLPMVLWFALKPILYKSKNHDLYLSAYKRLQYNPEIFNSLLQQQSKVPEGWQNIGIDIGNPIAEHTIIKVCNPYCRPCAEMHLKLEELLQNNSNIKLKIIFINGDNEIDKGSKVVKHLLAVATSGNIIQTQGAVNDWYKSPVKDYDLLQYKYPMNGELKMQGYKLEAMSQWSDAAEVTQTPTLFINGFRLPENYTIEELKYTL